MTVPYGGGCHTEEEGPEVVENGGGGRRCVNDDVSSDWDVDCTGSADWDS